MILNFLGSTSSITEVLPQPNEISRDARINGIDVLMIGTGEYTTGFIDNKDSQTDKNKGVVALTLFDLRMRNKVRRLGLCGVNGTKFPKIRNHFEHVIQSEYSGLDVRVETFPDDKAINPKAYLAAIKTFKRGDAAIIFTPDDTHFDIALECVKAGLHVLVTKPLVKTLEQHRLLHEAAVANNALVVIEVHKRFDPIYADARDKMTSLGPISYFYSYMSQPKYQLETFKSWAGKSSDISYYLNSHHIDFHEWCANPNTGTSTHSRPITVTATASTGVAMKLHNIDCEDTITLTVQWENLGDNNNNNNDNNNTNNTKPIVNSRSTAVYTASWIAANNSDVHSQQRFFAMCERGEVTVDQAHRGYTLATDSSAYKSVNPLFMKYTPTDGRFSGQQGYGYRSIEAFIDAVTSIQHGVATCTSHFGALATIANTYQTTAILEAGRRSLDSGKTVRIMYNDEVDRILPTGFDS